MDFTYTIEQLKDRIYTLQERIKWEVSIINELDAKISELQNAILYLGNIKTETI